MIILQVLDSLLGKLVSVVNPNGQFEIKGKLGREHSLDDEIFIIRGDKEFYFRLYQVKRVSFSPGRLPMIVLK